MFQCIYTMLLVYMSLQLSIPVILLYCDKISTYNLPSPNPDRLDISIIPTPDPPLECLFPIFARLIPHVDTLPLDPQRIKFLAYFETTNPVLKSTERCST
jgi:hypothetical protein